MGSSQSTPVQPPSPTPLQTKSAEAPLECPVKKAPAAPAVVAEKCPVPKDSAPAWARRFCPHLKDEAKPAAVPAPAAVVSAPSSPQSADSISDPKPECPVKNSSSSSSSSSSATPKVKYNVYSQPIDPNNNMPLHANNLPSYNQTSTLSQARVPSTIQKGNGDVNETWTYPSPQMFWNSINRKNKVGDTKEGDIETVVAIHNNMNETTWKKVVEWEKVLSGKDSTPPKLTKFIGRPTDLAPKAYFKNLVGYPLPFDRHDWTVERADGSNVRYIIDYYYDESMSSKGAWSLPSMNDSNAVKSIMVDVRPAADGVYDIASRIIIMPLARLSGTTDFKPLDFWPTPELKAQVGESVKTWEGIIQSAKAQASSEDNGYGGNVELPVLSESEVKETNASLLAIMKDCKSAQEKVNRCKTDEECTRTSMMLSMCMAKHVCSLQHKAVVAALHGEDGESSKVDVALENMTKCLGGFDLKVLAVKLKKEEETKEVGKFVKLNE